MTFVGIDFSGDQNQWNPSNQASNVWVAEARAAGNGALSVTDLRCVQQLPGQGRPFARLAMWLSAGNFQAAAIDAPFSVPWWFFRNGLAGHAALLATVNGLPLGGARDFPTGNDFIASVAPPAGLPFAFSKPLRVTESYWRGRRVNIRSTVWAGVRPGAPFASACTKLLANAARPIWPWASGPSPLIEAFPAAQLRHWGLCFAGYNGLAGQTNRNAIVADLEKNRGLQVSANQRARIQANADALDAVLCVYAARAVSLGQLGVPLPGFACHALEGWIAVHS